MLFVPKYIALALAFVGKPLFLIGCCMTGIPWTVLTVR